MWSQVTTKNGNFLLVLLFPIFTDSMYELGAENRALDNGRFSALPDNANAHYGRLNMYKAWQFPNDVAQNQWFKVDLGRVILVNGISIQGDPRIGDYYVTDYKLQYSFDASVAVGALVTVKEETTSSERV